MFNYRIVFTAITACVGGLLFGYDTGFIGSTTQLASFQRDFKMTDNVSNIKANIVATLQAGCFFGSIFMSIFSVRYGRRWSMALAALVFNVGAILQVITTSSLGLLYAGRAVSGLGVGAASMLTPTYLSEVSPRESRGRIGTTFGCSIFFGITISYWIVYACERSQSPDGHLQWRIPMGLQLVPGALLFLGGLFISESPRWLIKSGRREEGLKNLCYIRMLPEDDPVLQQEYQDICASTDEELRITEGITFRDMFRSPYRTRLAIGFTVMFSQQFGGTNALTYYAPLLFSKVGLSGTSSSLFATGVYGIVKTCAALLFLFFMAERVGRRGPFVIGAICMGCCMLIVGVILACKPPDPAALTPAPPSVAMIVFIYVFCVSYAVSWGPIPFTYVSEIFPAQIRDFGVAMALATQWAFNYCISRIVPVAMDNIGWRTFLMFAIFNFCIAVFAFLVLRETSGVALENMDQLFATGYFMKRSQWSLHRPEKISDEIEQMELEAQSAKLQDNKHIERTITSSSGISGKSV
ncbi:general substrate transporter [Lipomyces oligophaga]|uniref:general substrate transporter n=1 Tax=Lipomyces oligophaga TaxID=45792 RepID=UPI0034CF67BE